MLLFSLPATVLQQNKCHCEAMLCYWHISLVSAQKQGEMSLGGRETMEPGNAPLHNLGPFKVKIDQKIQSTVHSSLSVAALLGEHAEEMQKVKGNPHLKCMCVYVCVLLYKLLPRHDCSCGTHTTMLLIRLFIGIW